MNLCVSGRESVREEEQSIISHCRYPLQSLARCHTHTLRHTWTHKQRGAGCIIYRSNQRQTKASVFESAGPPGCRLMYTHKRTLALFK